MGIDTVSAAAGFILWCSIDTIVQLLALSNHYLNPKLINSHISINNSLDAIDPYDSTINKAYKSHQSDQPNPKYLEGKF